jgi:hypothetical protein
VANQVALYSTQSLTGKGTIKLNDPNLLTGLSESFRLDLAGSALIDVQGDVQSFRGGRANGVVFNDLGNLNLVKFDSVANSTIVGQPVGHIEIANRSNVSIVTPSRSVGDRGGVTVVDNLRPIGPISLANNPAT